MIRFARAVWVTFAWWDKVPAALRGLAIAVVLRQVGLFPVGDFASLVEE